MNKHTLNAGDLRFRCAFLMRIVSVEHGITTEHWETAFSCWCDAMPLSGREYWEAAAVNRQDEVRFTIRFRQNVDQTMRILFNGHLYDITEIIDVENRHIKLELLGKSVTENGECSD